MNVSELTVLCLCLHGFCWLALVLVRLDQRRRRELYERRIDNANAAVRKWRGP